MKFSFVAILTAAVAVVSAIEPIVVDYPAAFDPASATDPSIDVNEPSLNEVVPAGKEFAFGWKNALPADAQKPVMIVLVYGEKDKMQPVAVLAESAPNTGSFKWTPDEDVYPATDDKNSYGIRLIVIEDGRNQWSNPFKLSNEDGPSPTATATETETETDTATEEPTEEPTVTPPSNTTTTAEPTYTKGNDTTTVKPTRTPTPTQDDDDEPPAETTTEAADSSAGRVVASFGMAGFLVAVLNLLI